MKKWFMRLTIAIGLALVVAGAGVYWAVRQTQHVPEFYSQATSQQPKETHRASEQLKEDVSRLQRDAAQLGSWRASFSDNVINGWLIEELPRRFPRLLANGVSDPQIVIREDRVLVAARYKHKHWDTVISFEIEVELTEEANMLAVRLNNLRAGALPLPLDQFKKGITKEAARGDVDIRWDMTNSGPVALVTVPRNHPKYAVSPVIIESIRLADGKLQLFGHTGVLAESIYKPHGPVHRFVSYRHARIRSSQPSASSKSRRSSLR